MRYCENMEIELSEQAVKEFIAIYKKLKGIELSYEDGRKKALDWINLYHLVKYGKRSEEKDNN